MQPKPALWNLSPALIAPEARGLWKGVAFVFPIFAGAHLGGSGLLLGPSGAPLPRISLTAGSTAERRATPYGPGIGISGASNLLQRDDYEPVVTSDNAGTGDFSMLVLANPIPESTVRIPLSQSDSAPFGALIMFNSTGAPSSATAGAVSLRTRDGTGSTDVSATSVLDGNYHLFAARRAGTTLSLWVDGILRGANSNTLRDITTGAFGFGIGQRAESTSNRLHTATSMVLAAAWNRALSDAELRLLGWDPFIMLRPLAEWRGAWTPPGGDAVLDVSGPAFAFAFETPGFSQTHNLNMAGMAFAQSLEPAGFSQLHGLLPREMNTAVFLDAAGLVMNPIGAPVFRTRTPVPRAKVKVPGPENRTARP